jgi:hypothetical protein
MTQSPNVLAAHQAVLPLIEHFEQQKGYYLSPRYQEAEARKDFIDPFWTALGCGSPHPTQPL